MDSGTVLQRKSVQKHQQGKLREAEQEYLQVLDSHPADEETNFWLGTLYCQLGKFEQAVNHLGKALLVNNAHFKAHNNIGLAYRSLGNAENALYHFGKAIEVNNNYVEAYVNLAFLLLQLNKFEEAEKIFKAAESLTTGDVDVFYGLGLTLIKKAEYDEAVKYLKEAYGLNTGRYDVCFNTAYAYEMNNNIDAAIEYYEKAIAIDDSEHVANYNLANLLVKKNENERAKVHYQKAIRLNNNYYQAYTNLGLILLREQNLEEAAHNFNKAVEIKPDYEDALINYGVTKLEQGNVDGAIELYDRAVSLNPNSSEAHFNKGVALLLTGNYKEGWKEYQWRLEEDERRLIETVKVDDLRGKKLLVRDEQGVGDTFQFMRYFKLLKELDAYVVFQSREKLHDLFAGNDDIDEVCVLGNKYNGEIDYEIPLLSLPMIFGTTADAIPAEIPYLKADEQKLAKWNEKIDRSKFNVGIVWKGNPEHKYDYKRSCNPGLFEQLAGINNVKLYNLQIDDADTYTAFSDDLKNEIKSFGDTAAVISSLDLVIAVDTAIVHLAGALGKAVWVLLPKVTDWRWLQNGATTEWYPTMRLIRQQTAGDWNELFARVKTALTETASSNDAVSIASDDLKITALELHTQGEIEEAQKHYEKLLSVNGGDKEVNFWLGLLLYGKNEHQESAKYLLKAYEQGYEFGEEQYVMLSHALAADENYEKAIELLNEAYGNYALSKEIEHNLVTSYKNLAKLYTKREEFGCAEENYLSALSFYENDAETLNNLGFARLAQNKLDEAEQTFKQALSIEVEAGTYYNLGNTYYLKGEYEEAIACYTKATGLKPGYYEALTARGMTKLLLGNYEEGWKDYSQRLNTDESFINLDTAKQWKGESLEGKKLLVIAEQGVGDSIEFGRYLPVLQKECKELTFACRPEMMSLFGVFNTIPKTPEAIARAEYDYYVPLLELPRLLGTTVNNVPNHFTKLTVNYALQENWNAELSNVNGTKVGIVWSGSKENVLNRRRFLSMDDVLPLFGLSNFTFYVLEYGLSEEEKAVIESYPNVYYCGDTGFEEKAAIVSNLDIIIASDVNITHFASAYNKDVLLLLPFAPDWRWMLNRSDSPWYPNVKILRQKEAGNWSTVINEAKGELLSRYNNNNGAAKDVERIFALGYQYHQQNKIEKALECYQEVIRLNPASYNAFNNIGLILRDKKLIEEAERAFGISLMIEKNNSLALNNLGIIKEIKGEFNDALALYHKSIELKPDYAEAYVNLSNIHYANNDYESSLAAIDRAIEINPDYADAHFNKALFLLRSKQFGEGWKEYEWRKYKNDYHSRKFTKPELYTTDVSGKTVFVYDEQGYGDTIQFAMFLGLLKRNGARVILQTPNALVELMKNCAYVDEVIERTTFDEPNIDYDYHISLLSLPSLFDADENVISKLKHSYEIDEATNKYWNERLANYNGTKIGMVWQGKKPLYNMHRASSLDDYAKFANIPDAALFSLQKDVSGEEKKKLNELGIVDLSGELNSFNTTATVINNLDAVITIDTSVAHLAGALNKKTYTLLSKKADWRWFTNTNRSLWYPAMELFRQNEFGNWDDVTEKVLQKFMDENNKKQITHINQGVL